MVHLLFELFRVGYQRSFRWFEACSCKPAPSPALAGLSFGQLSLAHYRRLKSISDVRKFLAWVCNQVSTDEMDPQKGGRLAYISNVLKSCIQDGDLEKRVESLGRKINAR